jgi:hypothetical protein
MIGSRKWGLAPSPQWNSVPQEKRGWRRCLSPFSTQRACAELVYCVGMNYFAHALPFLDRPHFVAGTAVPDWLMVADRKVRVRSKHVEPFCDDADPVVAQTAAGIRRHLSDDARFHATRAFAETSLELTVRSRDALGGETGLRPAFLGHLLTEVLLDAALVAEAPGRLVEYYRALDGVDPGRVEAAVNRMAPRPTERLALFIELFRRERVLWDYLEDGRLMVRMNQVMRRVRLDDLPEEFAATLPDARKLVSERKGELLEEPRTCVTE